MTTRITTETKEVPCPGKGGFCNQTVDTGEKLCWHCEISGSNPEGTDPWDIPFDTDPWDVPFHRPDNPVDPTDGDDWGR